MEESTPIAPSGRDVPCSALFPLAGAASLTDTVLPQVLGPLTVPNICGHRDRTTLRSVWGIAHLLRPPPTTHTRLTILMEVEVQSLLFS
ncbi:hypothetical protein V2G26_019716 [Clonostachys chloroleuca]